MDLDRRKYLIGGSIVGILTLGGLLPATCAMQQIGRRSEIAGRVAPKRPPGHPKPSLDEDIAPVLAQLDAWYAGHLSPDKYRFNPPAADDQIAAFEDLIGLKLTRAHRQLYAWHNGENNDRWGHIFGLPLLPLEVAAAQWVAWNKVLSEFDGNRYMLPGSGWPKGAVDPAYINPRWVPLTHDGSGNHIGLDFDPWPDGRVGQVILFGRDEDVKVVLAESLGKFLKWIADLLASGNFRLGRGHQERILREFRLKTPATDSFHEGARILLGAPGPFL